MSLNQRPYFVGLDVLRLFAALAVFVFHLQIHYWNKLGYEITLDGYLGRLGVSFFFLLSGFLLTYLLFIEKSENGSVKIVNFFIRRATRIWPLYYVVLIIAFFIFPFLLQKITGYQYEEKASMLKYFTYLANYDVAYGNYPKTPMLGVQWSLAVEEQFYVVLPFFFLLFCSKKPLAIVVCLLVIAFSIFYKVNVFSYYDTFSVMYNLFAGVLLSVLAFNYKKYVDVIFQNKYFAILVTILFITYMVFIQLKGAGYFSTVNRAVFEMISFSFFIYYAAFNASLISTVKNVRLLNWLSLIGKNYTYSIYLLHMVAIVFSQLLLHQFIKIDGFLIYVSVSLIILIVLCVLSERYIEKPFLRLKNRFY